MTAFPAFVYVSNAAWDYGLPTNRQQLPRWLCRYAPLLYSSPFSLAQILLRRHLPGDYSLGIKSLGPNLFLLNNFQFLPLVRGQIQPFKQLDERLIFTTLQRSIKKLGFKDFILWLYYPPSYKYLLGRLGETLSCYHCTDDHAAYAEMLGLDPEPVRRAEVELVRKVDVVFTTSQPLYEQKLKINPNTYLMPNVAEIEHFAPVARDEIAPAADLRHISRPIAGFIGAVSAYKLDLRLIEETACLLPEWNFVFVGPVGEGDGTQEDKLPHLPNLHFVGKRDYALLPSYLAAFDVCLIPYQLNHYTAGVFPLKFWEYMASGKPIVTTPLPALQAYLDYVEVGETSDSFAAALKSAVKSNDKPEVKLQRLALAETHSWAGRAEEIVKVLRTHL